MEAPKTDSWMLSDRGKITGPYTWDQLIYKANMREVTDKADIKEDSWENWSPVTQFIHPSILLNSEEQALIPNRYDAMFYGGIGIFIFAVFLIFVSPPLGIGFSIISIIIEIKAIQLGVKAYGKTKVGTMGNIFAGCWIVLQIFATIVLVNLLWNGLPL